MARDLRPPTGHVFRVERARGPGWYAKYRLPDGRQVQKRFGPAWTRRGMGFEHVAEPLRTRTLASQDMGQEVVLGYWEQLFRDEPRELQQEIEATMASIDAPGLSVFGHHLTAQERSYLQKHVSDLQIEEWSDRGHLVHLAEPDRFTARLRAFIDHCRAR